MRSSHKDAWLVAAIAVMGVSWNGVPRNLAAEPPSVESSREILRDRSLSVEARTQIMVLGSIHLAQQGDDKARSASLDAVLRALGRFQPQIIGVERIPRETIALWEREAPVYDEVLKEFAADALSAGRSAQKALSLDRRTAEAQAAALVETFKDRPTDEVPAAERARAAVLLAAAYDFSSATLQWNYAVTHDSRADPASFAGVPSELREALSKSAQSRAEDTTIGLALARRLGLQRVYAIDDQSDAMFQVAHGQELMSQLQESAEFKKLQESMLFTELPARIGKSLENDDLIGLYRWINSAQYAAADVGAQWHIFLRTRFPGGFDRARAAFWEARNLAIAANIRRATASASGKRALVVIGASHRPFLEAYLSQMMDVDIVSPEEVLRP
jgi:hypothetical protein